MTIGAPLLPINSALVNILYFMSLLAGQDFVNQVQPRSFSTPNYRDIQITSYAWTEARFLLWGICYAAYNMIKLARFNDVMLQLYWEDRLVGKVKVARKRALSLVGGAGNLTQDLEEELAQPNSTGSDEDTTQPKPVVGNVTDSGLVPPTFSHINASTTLSLPSSFAVSFESIAGAGPVDRNDVFLTFYAALLHVAQFPAQMRMREFDIAVARWQFPFSLSAEQQVEKEELQKATPARPEGWNKELEHEFSGALDKLQEKWVDDSKDYVLLGLAVLPTHQRLGLGSLLIRKGLAAADEVGARTYLESSAVGVPLYLKHGFKQVDEILIDMRPYEGTGIASEKCMMRKLGGR
ncbi:MAG: hypothetical protein Q9161_008006 [Pseudevernia consocians]